MSSVAFSTLYLARMAWENCTDKQVDTGDTTWVLISAVLVLGMLPALAFFEV